MGDKVIEAAEPAISSLAQTLIGAGFIVILAAACLMVWQLIRIQNARVQDQKDIADRVERLTNQQVTVLTTTKEALNGLEKEQVGLNQQLIQISTKLDFLVAGRT